MTMPLNNAYSVLDVGGQEAPRRSVQQCRTCSSPFRDRAETMLMLGRSPWAIEQELGPDSGITRRHLADHVRHGHLPPLRSLAVAKAREEVQKMLTEAAEGVVKPLVALLGFTDAILTNVATRVASGDLLPDVKDAVAAGRLRLDIECAALAEMPDTKDFGDALMMVIEIAQDLLDRDQFEELQHRVEAHPLVARLRAERARSSVGIGA